MSIIEIQKLFQPATAEGIKNSEKEIMSSISKISSILTNNRKFIDPDLKDFGAILPEEKFQEIENLLLQMCRVCGAILSQSENLEKDLKFRHNNYLNNEV
jgi:hypothetical protein